MPGTVRPGSVHLMEGRRARNGRRGYRRAVRLRSQQRGVVAVIGTLLALLLFFALFGIFLTQYLPLWMSDNEVQFTSEAQQSMASLQSYINVQYQLGRPAAIAVPFTMQSDAVPLLSQPTAALLAFTPATPGVFACISVTSPALCTAPVSGEHALYNISLGTLQMQLGNRYYPPQTFEFEDDAVIQSQGPNSQLVDFPPLLSLNTVGGALNVTMALLQFYGNATTTVSSGTQDVFSHYKFTEPYYEDHPSGFNLTFEVGTDFPCAWQTFLTQLATTAGLVYTVGYSLLAGGLPISPTTACSYVSSLNPSDVIFTLHAATRLNLLFAGTQLTIGIGGS
ncbi:MAG: hypothetical protein WAN87_03220 [Thermoplasmata archaeon]